MFVTESYVDRESLGLRLIDIGAMTFVNNPLRQFMRRNLRTRRHHPTQPGPVSDQLALSVGTCLFGCAPEECGNAQRVVGVPWTGMPLASGLACKARRECLFLRKEWQGERYCIGRLSDVPENVERVVVVDDFATEGFAIHETIGVLEDAGMKVVCAMAFVGPERGSQAELLLEDRCPVRAIFRTPADFLDFSLNHKRIPDELVGQVQDYVRQHLH